MYERTYKPKSIKIEKESSLKKPFPWKKLLLFLTIFLVLIGAVMLVRLERFQIKTITTVGTHVADPIEVSQFALERLGGYYLYALPRSSTFLINTNNLEEQIKKNFARFKSVSIERDSIDSLKINVTEYTGAYLWCDESDKCSFLDEKGTAFADAPYFSGNAYLKIYGSLRDSYPFNPLSHSQIETILKINDRLKEIDIYPQSFSVLSERRIDATFVHNGNRAKIKFDLTMDVDRSFITLFSGMKTEPFFSLYHNKDKKLEYIDLLSPNKLTYKFE